MEPILYSDPDSYDSRVLRWMSIEKECLLEHRVIQPWEVRNFHLPLLQDRDLTLISHEPIVQYLQERYPGEELMPGDPKVRAQIRQICWMIRDGDEEFVNDLRLILSRVTYIAGASLTMADIYAGVRLHEMREEGLLFAARVEKYYQRLAGRRAFKEAIG